MTTRTLNVISVKKEILVKCIQDPSFKETCLKNPRKAIEHDLKIELPEEVQVKALEDTDKTLNVVLPSKMEAQDLPDNNKELDEEFPRLDEGKKELNLFVFKQFLILKSLKNPDFKSQLLANPNGAIEKLLKMSLPKDIQFRVFEDTEHMIYVALPSDQALEDLRQMGELSDEELKDITGGFTGLIKKYVAEPIAKWLSDIISKL